jgi:putative tryptophan/tyrosine transport system substrate-binding protein
VIDRRHRLDAVDPAQAAGLNRRCLLLALAAAVGTSPAAASDRRRPARIGIVAAGSPEPANANIRAFLDALREAGLEEGRDVVLDIRWARGVASSMPELTTELVMLPVDVILASNNNVTAAAQRATRTTPIVMVLGVEPVAAGFIQSYARPGGNITGLTNLTGTSMNGKMLALLKELLPRLVTIGILNQAGVGTEDSSLDDAARDLRLGVVRTLPVNDAGEIPAAIAALKQAGAQALYVVGGALIYSQRQKVVELSLQHRLPGIHFSADYVRAGGLISYGTDLRAQYRRAASYVSRILAGARPAELPVEQPARFEMAINLATARALGIVVPNSLLLRVDEVIG